jgi:hypothetical protein
MDETTKQAIRNALKWVLKDFKESGAVYEGYKAFEHFTDEKYDDMVKILEEAVAE